MVIKGNNVFITIIKKTKNYLKNNIEVDIVEMDYLSLIKRLSKNIKVNFNNSFPKVLVLKDYEKLLKNTFKNQKENKFLKNNCAYIR